MRDAKPMDEPSPAEIMALLRASRTVWVKGGPPQPSQVETWAADCIDAQAAEITALRAERDAARSGVDPSARRRGAG